MNENCAACCDSHFISTPKQLANCDDGDNIDINYLIRSISIPIFQLFFNIVTYVRTCLGKPRKRLIIAFWRPRNSPKSWD